MIYPMTSFSPLFHPVFVESEAEKLEFENECQTDAQKIQRRYPRGLSSEQNIDFSGLGLKHIPPHIFSQCLQLKRLDLSGNDIHWLPEELKSLNLVELNISRNVRLQPNLDRFSWLLHIPDLRLIANDMGFDFRPSGWDSERFKSNEIQSDDEWMRCPAQEDLGESD